MIYASQSFDRDPLIPSPDKDCGLPPIDNGYVVDTSSQTVSPGGSLVVRCNAGYTLNSTLDAADGRTDGSATIECVRATVFSPVLPDPTCIPQVCVVVLNLVKLSG